MLAEIESVTGVHSKLIPGGGGIFDVSVDGVTVFSKRELGRFPKSGEIAELLSSA